MINATSPSSGETSSASEAPLSQRLGRRLLRYGIVLFLLGLTTGRLVEYVPLPRMGLSSHLQGVMNGTFLVVAAGGHMGTPDQELTLLVGLRALNVAMFASCFLVLWCLRGEGPPRPGSRSPC